MTPSFAFPESYGKYIQLLESMPAGSVGHSGSNLQAHLICTAQLLAEWGCPPYVCVAGMFHSIYGTAGFKRALAPIENRNAVAEQIGREAEQLVYLFCIGERRSLFANVDGPEPYTLRNRQDKSAFMITAATLADLLTLDLANMLEQLPRLSLPQELMEKEKQTYTKALRFLPTGGVQDFLRVFGR